MSILFLIHSFLRWVILLVAAATAVKFAIGWARSGAYRPMDRGLYAGFTGLMDLQALLGIILLVWLGFSGGGFTPDRLGHSFAMILAVVVAHLPARWKTAPDPVRYRNGLLAIAGALVFIALGLIALAQG